MHSCEGDHPGLDLHGICFAIAAIFLIGIVVLSAQICVVFGHVRPLEREAISRAAIYAEDVPVVHRPPIDDPILRAVSNQIDLLFGEWVASDKKWGLLRGEKSKGVAARRCRDAENRRKLRIQRQNIKMSGIHNQIAGGSLPIILPSDFQNLIWQPKIFDAVLSDPNISTQRPLFLVIRSFPLFLCVNSSSSGSSEYKNKQNNQRS